MSEKDHPFEEAGMHPNAAEIAANLYGETRDLIKEQHDKEVAKLRAIEDDFIALIGESGDDELMSKYLEFSEQRTACNESLLEWLKSI